MTSTISCPLWSSMYECQRLECALIFDIDICNCDVFSVVNVYLDQLKFCVVCIYGRRYVCCSECNVVSNDWNVPTTALRNLSVRMVVKS